MRMWRLGLMMVLVVSLVWAVPSPAMSELDELAAEQTAAADAVIRQLSAADRPLRLDEIVALDELGPNPWTSLTPRPNAEVARAWRAVVNQLPDAGPRFRLPVRPPRITESEAVGETGANDTAGDGDLIARLGTVNDKVRAVIINGSLSGGDVRLPSEVECESVEDDGAITSASPSPLRPGEAALCIASIGDGPFGETSGDIDMFSLGEVLAGAELIVDVAHNPNTLGPLSRAVIGIYDADGNLLGSAEDSGAADGAEFLSVIAPTDGEYFAVIAGCCELGGDPFDSSSGPGANLTGTYDVFLVSATPPCVSTEDDGSIPQANRTAVEFTGLAVCPGVIGDGPFGATSGDVDFYQLGEVEVGKQVRVEVFGFDGLSAVAGIYDASGTLVAQAQQPANLDDALILVFEPSSSGVHYLAVAGCCELASDPFDPASGPGVASTGAYQVFISVGEPGCESIEDDGAITSAAETRIAGVGSGVECAGVMGDGPFAASSGDLDYYRIADVDAGELLVVDLLPFQIVPVVVGIYDADGNLVASADTSDTAIDSNFTFPYEVVTPGDHFVAIASCCELASDPFDPASGPGAPETPPFRYNFLVNRQAPPCLSGEDDGAIPLANDASFGSGDDEVFFTSCTGQLGDGPHADTTGDLDFYTTREIQAGKVLVVDFFGSDDESASDFTIGVYDAAGNLLASGTDSASPTDDNFFRLTVPETGVYHVAVTGGLPTDPFNPQSGTNTSVAGPYQVFLVDIAPDVLDGAGEARGWGARVLAPSQPAASPTADRPSTAEGLLAEVRRDASLARAEAADEEPAVDVDVFLVDLLAGDVIAGGFDNARVAGIIRPDGTQGQESVTNVTFIYPADSVLRHGRRTAFDHVAETSGRYAVYVANGVGAYEGELRVVRPGRSDQRSSAQQIIFLDFDGARIAQSIFNGDVPGQTSLSPLSSFLGNWGLSSSDEDAVIDSVIDSVIENIDTDLRIVDGRNGDRDRTGTRTEFDVLVLNSRDHGDRWGEPDVSRIIIGGTIDELGVPTIGLAQSIDPGNTVSTETGVVLLDLLSAPAGDVVSLNSYEVAPGRTMAEFVGYAVGHIAAHEVGHFIGNWHTETFNDIPSLMDAGGEFASIFGVGPDGVFGTADDVDADFVADMFNVNEGFVGTEDTAARSGFAFSTGRLRAGPAFPAVIGDRFTRANGLGVRGATVQLLRVREGGLPGPVVARATTSQGGVYRFRTAPGCYLVRFTAPPRASFPDGGSRLDVPVCVREAEVNRDIDAVLAGGPPA